MNQVICNPFFAESQNGIQTLADLVTREKNRRLEKIQD